MFGTYWTKKFSDVYPNVETFLEDYNNVGIPTTISDTSATTLYYLLIARYANSSIANFDQNQFKYKLFGIIFSKGATWEKRLEIQGILRDLSVEDLTVSSTIHNHAYNPGTAPSTQSLEELTTIDDQNTSKFKRNKLDAYMTLMSLLERDVTTEFLDSFRDLFVVVLEPQAPLLYRGDN